MVPATGERDTTPNLDRTRHSLCFFKSLVRFPALKTKLAERKFRDRPEVVFGCGGRI